jgi:hypothetical protein
MKKLLLAAVAAVAITGPVSAQQFMTRSQLVEVFGDDKLEAMKMKLNSLGAPVTCDSVVVMHDMPGNDVGYLCKNGSRWAYNASTKVFRFVRK